MLYKAIQNCFYKLRGVIVPIQTTNNYIGTQGRIPFWETDNEENRNLSYEMKQYEPLPLTPFCTCVRSMPPMTIKNLLHANFH